MNILGIETSCDETAASVVEDGIKILSHVVASSYKMHIKTGGVVPEQAARQQIKAILPVIQQALVTDIDAIAVTVGPGLIGSLLVGVETAKTLAYLWQKPIIPVNHLLGHVYANWLLRGSKKEPKPTFPALAGVVSGGHTDLIVMESHRKLQWLGGTRDDAAGEAFDKTARLLGLNYPGGPAIAAEAEKYLVKNPKAKLNLFPRPLINQNNYDFSFSGLKTAVLKEIQSHPNLSKLERSEIAAQIQEAIVDVLVTKSLKAIKRYQPQSFLLAGGVAANQRLREKLQSEIKNLKFKVNLFIPEPKLCTDNATFIAAAGFFSPQKIAWQKITANPKINLIDPFLYL